MHRINFRISKELLDRFHTASLKAGIPKSYLLRDWINEVNVDELYAVRTQNQGDGMSAYNFVTEEGFKEKIEYKAQTMGIEVSEFLRRIIDKFCNKHLNSDLVIRDAGELVSLCNKGAYNSVVNFVENMPEHDRKPIHIVRLAEAYKELGQLDKSSSLIGVLKDECRIGSNIEFSIDLLTFDIATFNYDQFVLESLEKKFIKSLLPISENREFIGKLNLRLGFYYLISDQLDNASNSLLNSIETLDIINFPVEIATAYLYFSILEAYKLDFLSSKRYTDRAIEIALKLSNKNLLVKAYHMVATNYFRLGNIKNSEVYVQKMLAIDSKYYTPRDRLYVHDDLGRISMYKSDFKNAYKQFMKADKIVKEFGYIHYSAPKVYIDLITSRNTHARAKNTMTYNMSGNERVYLKKYAFYSKKFLYGKISPEINEGIIGLKKLADYKCYPLLAKAAKATLDTKQLQFMR